MKNAALYAKWLAEHAIENVPSPDETGLFERGTLRCVLPFLFAYWKVDQERVAVFPSWETPTWDERAKGWVRFLRADQALDWIATVSPPDAKGRDWPALKEALDAWLVLIDDPLVNHPSILDRRVEAIRVWSKDGRLTWSRRPDWFPDEFRRDMPGLDPVHTPENARAGLTRYLPEGWEIGDHGKLAQMERAESWGPSTSRIPCRCHDAPRRLMLGASLQTHAVHLQQEELPAVRVDDAGWEPPGRNLHAAISAYGGWTHEDAIVLSESAVAKLTTRQPYEVRLLVPAVVGRLEMRQPGPVRPGETLVRAFIDLFAMGHRRKKAEQLGAEDGWLEISLPGATVTQDACLLCVRRRKLRLLKWRELLIFDLEKSAPVSVGDKLSTRHGIKGVVSKILCDNEMPPAGTERADIVLSPVGIAKRGAMGQFRELEPHGAEPARSGTIFVMRQPQDSRPRCRVCGKNPAGVRGQRYGEMEFWALMAHGASSIAKELLSVGRSTASWMTEGEAGFGSTDHRKLVTRAVNRYLAIIGARIEAGRLKGPDAKDGRLVVRKSPDSFEIPVPTFKSFWKSLEDLEEPERFAKGGTGAIKLDPPVSITLAGTEKRTYEVVFEAIHVIPPWLRPKFAANVKAPYHELSKAYARLLEALCSRSWFRPAAQKLPALVARCVALALGDDIGVGAFLRREVFGRRLTRSARAVIVPRPDLRIDQISLPKSVAHSLFEDLPDQNRRFVLVNRNPTLHRQGLLAMRPVIDESDTPVFGFPLGVLKVLGADFDGDQACVVALETEPALKEAERLLPGAETLRADPFRPNQPAFPLCKELASLEEESVLACDVASSQEEWCQKHDELIRRRLHAAGDGWDCPVTLAGIKDCQPLWEGLDEKTWLDRASEEMETVYVSVRKKGQLGGVLRRQLYRRAFTDSVSFQNSVDVLHTVTERLTQSALSVRGGAGAAAFFPVKRFFDDPSCPEAAAWLKTLDPQLDHQLVSQALGSVVEPVGLLAWLANPTVPTLLDELTRHEEVVTSFKSDPRIAWFLDGR